MQTKTYHNHLSPSETLEEAIRVIGYQPVSNKPCAGYLVHPDDLSS